jgi:hypothetical protein
VSTNFHPTVLRKILQYLHNDFSQLVKCVRVACLQLSGLVPTRRMESVSGQEFEDDDHILLHISYVTSDIWHGRVTQNQTSQRNESSPEIETHTNICSISRMSLKKWHRVEKVSYQLSWKSEELVQVNTHNLQRLKILLRQLHLPYSVTLFHRTVLRTWKQSLVVYPPRTRLRNGRQEIIRVWNFLYPPMESPIKILNYPLFNVLSLNLFIPILFSKYIYFCVPLNGILFFRTSAQCVLLHFNNSNRSLLVTSQNVVPCVADESCNTRTTTFHG